MASREPGEERLFRLVLSLRQEKDPSLFDSYFFDSSIVYVYARRGASPIDLISNLIHELGHALLADTPLGFVHLSLFELSAVASDYLWHRFIYNHLERNTGALTTPPKERLAQLEYLETVGTRPFSMQEQARQEADALFNASSEDLRFALEDPHAHALAETLLVLDARRQKLIDASRVCHEALATFCQLHDDPEGRVEYEEMIRAFFPSEIRETLLLLPETLDAKRLALSGIWKKGYDLSQMLYKKVRKRGAVLRAAHAALHFPYYACNLLDMPFQEFSQWLESPLLSPTLRFESLCQSTKLQECLVGADHDNGRALLSGLVENHKTLSPLDNDSMSFRAWHTRYVIQSDCCKPIRQIIKQVQDPVPSRVADNWSENLLPVRHPRPRPPILYEDGSLLAPNREIASMVRSDFIHATRLKSVIAVLKRLMQ